MRANLTVYGDIMQSVVQTVRGGRVSSGGARIIYYYTALKTQNTSHIKLYTAVENTIYDITFQVARHLQLDSDFVDGGYTVVLETGHGSLFKEIKETIIEKLSAAFVNEFLLETI